MEIEATAQASSAIGQMLKSWDYMQSRITRETVGIYLGAVSDLNVDAVIMACKAFSDGSAPDHNFDFAPTAPKLAHVARLYQQTRIPKPPSDPLITYRIGETPPAGYVSAGLMEVDFGHRRINMRNMSHAEKEAVMSNKGLPREQLVQGMAPLRIRRME